MKTLAQACTPRSSIFDSSIRDTVYNIDDLKEIPARRFFEENYVTQGMRQLLTEAFKRLEGKSQSASGAFLLSQSMGGGKTHNLLALGLLARHPELREQVMGDFYSPGPLGAVRVVSFSGRKTNTQLGIWGEIAEQLNKREAFRDFYSPLKPPGDDDWISLLRGEPTLILLDELPPYFEAMQAISVGATNLAALTTTALANLLVAVTSDKLPHTCVVLTDLRASAYGAGSDAMNSALRNLQLEANRSVVPIDPVRLASDELYQILRTRLFEEVADNSTIETVAEGYARAIDEARRVDLTTASAQQMRADILNSYPFHPGIRDLFARFKENPGFQQTRALIRIMRAVVAELWQSGQAKEKYLVTAHDLNLQRPAIMSEIRQINPSLDTAVAHDITSEGGGAVAEEIDAELGGSNARDSATLIFLASLSQAVNPTLGLDRSEIVKYLAAPQREVTRVKQALDRLYRNAWYLHTSNSGALLFKNVENLNAKQESYAQGMLREVRESELRERLKKMFEPSANACYGELALLPALDQVQLSQDRITLVVFRPSAIAQQEISDFHEHQPYKNRVLFLTGNEAGYQRVLERSAYLRAIRLILDEFRQARMLESDPQFVEATRIRDNEETLFYIACRETFQRLLYPTHRGLNPIDFNAQYEANKYEGERQVVETLKRAYKYEEVTEAALDSFRTKLESKLWPEGSREVAWGEIKRRAATDPSWQWHAPGMLEYLKDQMLRRDQWRELSAGFLQRGPFPKPQTSVEVQRLYRDPATGEATLRIRPLHADTVYMSEDGPATSSSPRLEEYDLKTRALKLSFLAVDSTGEHKTGEPVSWQNTIEVKYRFFQEGERVAAELEAVPPAPIHFTVDGSSPDTAGRVYERPFALPDGARLLLARAAEDGVSSEVIQVAVPKEPTSKRPSLDPRKPATWRRRIRKDSTGESYEFLELASKHGAMIGGIRLVGNKSGRWVELSTDDQTFQPAPTVREQMTFLSSIVEGANLTLEAETLRFNRGQELQELVAAMRESLQPGEVEQPA